MRIILWSNYIKIFPYAHSFQLKNKHGISIMKSFILGVGRFLFFFWKAIKFYTSQIWVLAFDIKKWENLITCLKIDLWQESLCQTQATTSSTLSFFHFLLKYSIRHTCLDRSYFILLIRYVEYDYKHAFTVNLVPLNVNYFIKI